MTDIKIYLSGGMESFGKDNYEKSNNWRLDVKDWIEKMTDNKVKVFNPNDHWNFTMDESTINERECMDYDIWQLRNSDLVIYNNNDPYSRGSMAEIAIAYERKIPIIILNEDDNALHCWMKCMSNRVFDDREDMMYYLAEHYLNE